MSHFSHIPSSSLVTWQNGVLFALALKLQYILYDLPDPWNPTEQLNIFVKIFHTSVSRFAHYWNGYQIHGMEKILNHKKGGSLLVGYHSRPTLDLVYLLATLKPKIIVTHLFFRIPLMQGILDQMGLIPSKTIAHRSPEECFIEAITTPGRPTVLLPGGIYDALKPYDQKYMVNWNNPPGFARVMCNNRERLHQRGGVQVIPFYIRNGELLYGNTPFLHDNLASIGKAMYDSFMEGNYLILPPMMTVLLSSLGFIFLPSRVKVETFLGEPLMLQDHETAEEFGKRVANELQQLLNNVRKLDEPQVEHITPKNAVDMITALYMTPYVFVQNVGLLGVILGFIWSAYPPIIAYSIYKQVRSLLTISKSSSDK